MSYLLSFPLIFIPPSLLLFFLLPFFHIFFLNLRIGFLKYTCILFFTETEILYA